LAEIALASDFVGQRMIHFRRLLLLLSLLLAKVALPQANIVDVPNNDTLSKGQLFFQAQMVISEQEIKTGAFCTWGLGKDFEVGFNIHQLTFERKDEPGNVDVDPEKPGQTPSFLINARKGFGIKPWYRIGVGGRWGVSLTDEDGRIQPSIFSYLVNQFSIKDTRNKFIIGAYYSNINYGGPYTTLGVMGGFQLDLVKDKISFATDFFSGNSLLSVINTGFEIDLTRSWSISFGAQIPFPGRENSPGGYIQISKK
jgi:hypothetical protein